jgi:hypothetical protein
MSKEDGIDEHGIDWLCGCHLLYGFDSEVEQITPANFYVMH